MKRKFASIDNDITNTDEPPKKNFILLKKSKPPTILDLDDPLWFKIFEYIPQTSLAQRTVCREWNSKVMNCPTFWISVDKNNTFNITLNNIGDFFNWSRKFQLIGLYKSNQINSIHSKITKYNEKYLRHDQKRNLVHLRAWLKKTHIFWPFAYYFPKINIELGQHLSNDFFTGRRAVKLVLDEKLLALVLKTFLFTDPKFAKLVYCITVPVQYCKYIPIECLKNGTKVKVVVAFRLLMNGYRALAKTMGEMYQFSSLYCARSEDNNIFIQVEALINKHYAPFWLPSVVKSVAPNVNVEQFAKKLIWSS